MATDYYSTLGIGKGASEKEIRQAYRKLARQYHPDVNPGDGSAEARFKQINGAYEVLSDAEKRRKYDKYGDQWEHADQIEEMQRRAGGQTFRFGDGGGAGFSFGDLGDLGGVVEGLFGRRRPQGPRKGADAEHPVQVTLEEAFHGTTRTLQMVGQEPCPTCGGTGQIANAVCHVCEGSGVAAKPRTLEVKIPPGVDNGSRVRIAGEGGPGVAGGARGDLYLVTSVLPHQQFERRGSDLYVDVQVPIADAVLGTEVEVPTLTGKVMLKVPELTPNGKPFRIAGKGMPKLRGGERGQGPGNLYARVVVRVPDKLSDRERKLFEELRAARRED